MTLKDRVHQCVKEAITIQVAQQLTWWGVNNIKFAFYNSFMSSDLPYVYIYVYLLFRCHYYTILIAILKIIYYFLEAVGSNRYYPKPTREEFQKEVVASLKVAKQRLRNSIQRHPGIQGRRKKLQAAADVLYNDENQSESENSENSTDTENESGDSGEHS